MKNFTPLLFLALGAFPFESVAQGFQIATPATAEIPTFRQIKESVFNAGPSRMKASQFSEDIITEAPEGVVKTYTVEAFSFYVAMGSYVGYEQIETAREAVVTDDALYLQGPLGAYNEGTYMKAEKKDETTYIVKLPCPIYSETYMDWEANEEITVNYELRLMDGVVDEAGEITGYTPNDVSEVELSFVDGVITLDLGYEPEFDGSGTPSTPEKILGLCVDNGNWAGYGDASFKWTPFEEEVAVPPSDMTIENWVLASEGLGKMIRIGFSGNEVWIGDLQPNYIPDSWVKGTIDGDKVVIENGQYMGIIESQFVYFVLGIVNGDYGASVVDSYEFDYDAESKTIKANDPNLVIAISATPESVIEWVKWIDPSFIYQPEVINPLPQTPFNLRYDDWFEDYGYAVFSFDESNMNASGHLLDSSNMYYRIFFDDELEEFGDGEYSEDFPDPTTDIPFELNSYHFWTWDITHQASILTQGLNTIGVQVISIIEDETYSSPIVTLDIETGEVTTGIDNLGEDSVEIEVVYFDLNGRRITNPAADGIYVRKATKANGSIETSKIRR